MSRVKIDEQTFRQVKTALKERTQKQIQEKFKLSHSTVERIAAVDNITEYKLQTKIRNQREYRAKKQKTQTKKPSLFQRLFKWA
jgi:hypothetical protein